MYVSSLSLISLYHISLSLSPSLSPSLSLPLSLSLSLFVAITGVVVACGC